MADTKGTHLLKKSDFVDVVDEEGNDLGYQVPKHWGADQLAPGAKKKGRSTTPPSGSGSASGSSGGGSGPQKPEGEPAGNASTEAWVAYAKEKKGATDADLVDGEGKPLGQQALREKFGTPAGS